jgi:DNA-binding transcriptional LysR family regulator
VNWDDLRVFLAAHREGSYAAAGRVLNVNATTVARRLERLEDDLGGLVFQRTADGLVATAMAETILEHAKGVERVTSLIANSAKGQDDSLAGTVSISVTHAYASHFFMRHLRAFRSQHPNIDVEVRTSSVMIDLSRGEADLAMRFRSQGSGPGVPTGAIEITAQRLGTMGVSVYASRGYIDRCGKPDNAFDIDGHDVVLPRSEATFLPGGAWFAEAAKHGRATLSTDDIDSLASAAAADIGLTCLPTFVGMAHDNLVRLAPPRTVDARDMWLLMPADLKRVARVRALRKFVVDLHDTWAPLLGGDHEEFGAV